MTLAFQTKWTKNIGELAGKPNFFVEKIWKGIYEYYRLIDLDALKSEDFSGNTPGYQIAKRVYLEDQMSFYEDEFKYLFGEKLINKWTVASKLHTIRPDPSNRWKPGAKIHFVINNRTKDRFQFAPVVEVKSVQKIEISSHGVLYDGERTADGPFGKFKVKVDNLLLSYEDAEYLAINDGFKNLAHFLHFFPKQFTGKIIHWTNKTY